MQLVPYLGAQPVRSDDFSIVVDPTDQERIDRLVTRASAIHSVNDSQLFELAHEAAGQMKSMLNEIEDAKRAAKRPFSAVEQAIENKAKSVRSSLEQQDKRVRGMMNAYVAEIERAARAEAKRQEDILRAGQAEVQRRLEAAQAAQHKAEQEARAAKDELEQVRLRAEAERAAQAAMNAELEAELNEDLANFGQPKAVPPKVPGGRVTHPYEFELVDVRAVVAAGAWRLVRWELDKLACLDAIHAVERINPTDPNPQLPGIKVTRKTSVSIRASA